MKKVNKSQLKIVIFYSREKWLYVAWVCFRSVVVTWSQLFIFSLQKFLTFFSNKNYSVFYDVVSSYLSSWCLNDIVKVSIHQDRFQELRL